MANPIVAESVSCRDTCEKILSTDFKYASDNHVELQLWNAHLKVNTIFRKENRSVCRMS
jgi:hypothetical protein